MSKLYRRAVQAALLILLAVPQLMTLPSWFHTTWLGMSWGALVLTGMVATWSRARLLWLVYAALASYLAQASLMPALRCQRYQAWLLVGCLIAAGWLIGKLTMSGRGVRQQRAAETLQLPQLEIWDMIVLTTLTAGFCALWPRVEPSFHFLCQLVPALAGGLILSSLAAQWAWRDQWTELSLMMAATSLLLALLCLMPLVSWRSATLNQFGELVAWTLTGPVSVIAAQGTLVLAYLGATRRASASQTLLSS